MPPTRKPPAARVSTHTAAKAPRRARKNMRLSQDLLDAAKEALGLSDETETVTVALERIVANRRVARGIAAMGGRRVLDESRIQD